MSGKKPNQKSDPQLNTHWEICKSFLNLHHLISSDKELKQFRNSITPNKKLAKSIIPKILDLISKSCRSLIDYEEISQGLDSFLIILETLIKSSKAKFSKPQLFTFFNDLFCLTSLRSSSNQGKINTLALFLDNMLIMILNTKDGKDLGRDVFEHFLLFLQKFSDFGMAELLEGSVSMRESLTFDGTDFEKSHFLEYVLLVILSLSKYHDLACEFSVCQKLFEIILWLLEKPDTTQNSSKVYFLVNNLVLAFGILGSLSKVQAEKTGALIANEDQTILLIVQGCCSLAEIEVGDVPLIPMQKNPFVISKLFSILLNILGNGESQEDSFVSKMILELLKTLKKNWEKHKKGCQGVIFFHILEFLNFYFFEKQQHPSTLNIEKILIHPVWFLLDSEKIVKNWEKSVEKMMKICKVSKVKTTIVECVKDNLDSSLFLQGFNGWCENIKERSENVLMAVVGSGVASELLEKMAEGVSENQDLIFQIVNFFLSFKFVASPSLLVHIILEKIVMEGVPVQEFCEVWLAKLLVIQPDATISPFLQVLSKSSQQNSQEMLMNAVLKVSGDKSTQFTLHDQLISNHFLKVLSSNLVKSSQNPGLLIGSLWKKTFECFEKVLNSEDFLYKDVEIAFTDLSNSLTCPKMLKHKAKLISSTYKHLKKIVISPNYTSFRLPAGIPLLLHYLSQESLAKTRIKFEKMLKTSTNLNHSIKHGLVSYLISSISNSTATLLWSNPYKTLSNSISIHFSIQNLRQTLNLLETCQDPTQKLRLFESINDALACSPEKTSNFSFNSNNFLKVFFEPGQFRIQNEFSIILWFFPDCKSKCVLCTISCLPDSFVVKIVKEQVILVVNDSEFIVDEPISVNSWNLLSISCKFTKLARVVKSKTLTLGLNGVLKDFTESNKLNFSQKNEIQCLTLSSGFIGKVSGVYLYTIYIKKPHLDFLINISPYECPHFLSASLQYTENKQCQDLKSSLLYYCTKDSIFRFPFTQATVFCDTFNWSTIYQVIQAYDPSHFLVRVLKTCENEPEMITKVYEIIFRLILNKNFEVTEEFMQILGFYANLYYWDDRVFEVFLMILTNLNGKLAQVLLEGIFLRVCEFNNKSRHVFLFGKVFKELYPVNRENLFRFGMLIKNAEKKVIRKCLDDYLGQGIENKMNDLVAYVLVALINSQQIDVIEGFLGLFEELDTNFGCFTAISTVLIHVLEKVENDHLKISIIRALCFKNDLTNEENQLKILIFMIDEVMPNELSVSLNLFFLENSLRVVQKNGIREGFFSIVAKRLKFAKKSEIFQDFLRILIENKVFVKGVVYDSALFPECFIEIPENLETAKTIKLILVEIFYEAGKLGDFDKFSIFLREKPQISIFFKLLLRFDPNDQDALYEFANIFKEIPKHGLKFNLSTYLKTLAYLTSPSTLKIYSDSMNLKKMLEKRASTPMKRSEKKHLKYKFILIEILQILFNTLNYLPQNSEFFFSTLDKFLEAFQWFNKFQNSDNLNKKYCEILVSVYIFIELIYIQEEKNVDISEFLVKFINLSRIFEKIGLFLDVKFNSEVLDRFDKVPSNYAILSQQSIIDSVSEWTSPNWNTISPTMALDYNLLISYTKSTELEYLSTYSLSFFTHHNWQEVYEKLQTITKSFKKSITHIYRTSIEPTHGPNASAIVQYQKVLNEILGDPWMSSIFDSFDRVLLLNEKTVKKFLLNLQKMKSFLGSPVLSNKIRQVYDGCYRWTMMKYQYNKEKKIQNLNENVIESSANSNKNSCSSMPTRSNTVLYHRTGFKCEIELIRIQGSYFGVFEIQDSYIEVKFEGNLKPAHITLSSTPICVSKSKISHYFWPLSKISEVFILRTVHKPTSLEFILTSGKSFLLNFFSESDRNEVLSRLKSLPSLFHKSELKYQESLTLDWKKHKISNFVYLMILNKLAGRCLNDLSQYPVFPWILKNFEKFDLSNPAFYRNLSLPIGAQTLEMQKEAQKRFKASEEDFGSFHYGSHYSSPAVVCYYLLRIQPYTEQGKAIQGGCLDTPDRLFHSLKLAWNSCMSHIGDVKELVPELFFQNFILKNAVHCEYGTTQLKKNVTNVKLPNWATNELDFIRKHRVALESNLISEEIPNWIDLIFGFKQLGKASIDSLNTFSCTAREDSYKEVCEKYQKFANSFFQQAYHFGINPKCLFKDEKHGKREDFKKMYFLEKRYFEGKTGKLGKIKNKNEGRGRVQALFGGGRRVWMVKKVENEYFIVKFSTVPGTEGFLSSKEHVLEHFFRAKEGLFSNSFALFNEKLLVSGLSITNSLIIHNTKGKILFSVTRHTDLITSVACSSNLIFSASSDSTIFSWKVQENSIKPQKSYLGHTSSITQISVIDTYMLLISISEEGLILIHDFRSSFILRVIKGFGNLLATSELGLFVVGDKNLLKVWTANGENVKNVECEDWVKMIRFNELGDTFVQIFESFVVVSDPILEDVECKLRIQSVQDAVFGEGDRLLFTARDKVRDSRTEVCSLYIVQQS